MQKRTMELRSPERRQFDRDWASPVSSKLERSNILPAAQVSSNNPFNDVSKNLTQSLEEVDMQPRRDNLDKFRGRLESQLQTTTNFSDVLASRAADQMPAAPDGLDKLDELEQMALEALDDI